MPKQNSWLIIYNAWVLPVIIEIKKQQIIKVWQVHKVLLLAIATVFLEMIGHHRI